MIYRAKSVAEILYDRKREHKEKSREVCNSTWPDGFECPKIDLPPEPSSDCRPGSEIYQGGRPKPAAYSCSLLTPVMRPTYNLDYYDR